jgi:hypothetical protein
MPQDDSIKKRLVRFPVRVGDGCLRERTAGAGGSGKPGIFRENGFNRKKGEWRMSAMNNWGKTGIVLLAVGFVFAQVPLALAADSKEMKMAPADGKMTAQAAKKMDAKAEKMVMQGTGMMMKGKKDLMAGLAKQKLTKDPKLMDDIKKLGKGEKAVMEGNKMIKTKKTMAKEKIMAGTTMMMEASDAIAAELKSRGAMQEGKLGEGEKLITRGMNKMMEGKNGMMDGFKDWE